MWPRGGRRGGFLSACFGALCAEDFRAGSIAEMGERSRVAAPLAAGRGRIKHSPAHGA